MTAPHRSMATFTGSRLSHPAPTTHAAAVGIAVFAVSLLMSTAAHADDHGSWATHFGFGGVKGSGQMQTETRAVTGFQGVALKGSFKLVLRQATSEHVEVRADSNLLALIETRVVDRNGVPTLEIREHDNSSWSTKNDPVVTVDVVNLKSLQVSGSGDASVGDVKTAAFDITISGSGNVDVKHVESTELVVKVSGSGDVKLAGKTGKLAVKLSGSGAVDAFGLASDDAAVNISGSGNAKVDARKTLAVAVSGSGDVAYTGNPTVSSAIGGSGRLRQR